MNEARLPNMILWSAAPLQRRCLLGAPKSLVVHPVGLLELNEKKSSEIMKPLTKYRGREEEFSNFPSRSFLETPESGRGYSIIH